MRVVESDYGDETPAQTRARLERDANLVCGARIGVIDE